MTCGNPIKHKFQNAFNSFIDAISFERKLSDDQMECMQFGICDYSPKQVEEVPFFTLLNRIENEMSSKKIYKK